MRIPTDDLGDEALTQKVGVNEELLRHSAVVTQQPLIKKTADSPWVIVAGGIHRRGGMDKANAALAEYLASQHKRVHLVAFSVDSKIASVAGVVTSYATMPAHSLFLGGFHLARLGRRLATEATQKFAGTRVLANGINCDWPDINWVHWVHQCWNSYEPTAPPLFKLKHRVETRWAMRAERINAPEGEAGHSQFRTHSQRPYQTGRAGSAEGRISLSR